MIRIWSLYQKAIFEFVQNGSGNAVIEAVPGSGKSTTLVEALNYIPHHLYEYTVFLAFNNKIVDDLRSKVPKGVTCSTFHSFCFKVLRSLNPSIKIDRKGEKMTKIILSLVGHSEEDSELRYLLAQTVSLAKAYLAHDSASVQAVMDKHDINSSRIDFPELVVKALNIAAIQCNIVDFDDMIWFISRFNIALPSYAFVMIDEAQDSHPGRIDVCRRLLSPITRMFAVGDKNQVIFQFCGSCEDSMDQLRSIMNAKSFPLTVSYRCSRLIVAEARKYVSGIEASPMAHNGTVERVHPDQMIKEACHGDFIISRVNAPLVSLSFALLSKGKRANVHGRDLGKMLSYMIKLSNAETVDGLLQYVYNWANDQYEKISKRNGDPTYVTDRVSCIESLCYNAESIKDVKARIKTLFADADKTCPGDDKIICTSAHRSKGLEKNRVWLLVQTFKPEKSVEESNLMYVAITRAKYHLFLVSEHH